MRIRAPSGVPPGPDVDLRRVARWAGPSPWTPNDVRPLAAASKLAAEPRWLARTAVPHRSTFSNHRFPLDVPAAPAVP